MVQPARMIDHVEVFDGIVLLAAGGHFKGSVPAAVVGSADPAARVCRALGMTPPTRPGEMKRGRRA